jgi:hypothetical protein
VRNTQRSQTDRQPGSDVERLEETGYNRELAPKIGFHLTLLGQTPRRQTDPTD